MRSLVQFASQFLTPLRSLLIFRLRTQGVRGDSTCPYAALEGPLFHGSARICIFSAILLRRGLCSSTASRLSSRGLTGLAAPGGQPKAAVPTSNLRPPNRLPRHKSQRARCTTLSRW
jgi:hypothetical protein